MVLTTKTLVRAVWIAALALGPGSQLLSAQDKVTMTNGSVEEGTVKSFDAARKSIVWATKQGEFPLPLTSVRSVYLAPRPQFQDAGVALQKGRADEAISKLKPLVDTYLGLDVPWVMEAAGKLADAYATSGKSKEASDLYGRIAELYPKSPYRLKGKLAEAKGRIDNNAPGAALQLLDEVEKELEKAAIPKPSEIGIFGEIFFLRGLALEKENKLAEALHAYLKVVTIYHQPKSLVAEAQKRADDLRSKNAKLAVQ
jgi:tetratricopeptide (TPR) repeat protein